MTKRHLVELTDEQRADLDRRQAGPLTRRQRNRVQILLRADAGDTDAEIAEELGVSVGTVANDRRRFAAGGLDAALHDKPRPGAKPLLDGKAQAIVIATACSPVPEGRATGTARRLANRLVELQVVESVSEDTTLRVLKKASSSRGRSGLGACPRASTASSSPGGRTSWSWTPSRTTRPARSSASTRRARSCTAR